MRMAPVLLLVALLSGLGCAPGDLPPGQETERNPAQSAVAREVAADADPDLSGAVAAAATAATKEDAAEGEQGARRAQAQSYLDRARDDAQARHRLAIEHCRERVSVDYEACEATADESLEAELRAARVEFDAQMTEPH